MCVTGSQVLDGPEVRLLKILMKTISKIFAILFFVMAVLYLAGCSSAPRVEPDATVVPESNSVVEPRPTSTITDYEKSTVADSKYYTAEIRYPVFAGFDAVNERVEKIIMERFRQFDAGAESAWKEIDAERKATGATGKTPPFEFIVKCEPYKNASGFINVLINIYTYDGGAHGYTNLVSVNYDKSQKKFLSLADIDGWTYERASERSRASLKKQFASDASSMWIDEGTTPTAENFSTFTYDGKTITIYFEQYQVAPYAYGIQTVSIKN